MNRSKFLLIFIFLSLFLMSGCGTINIYQTIYRDGTFDLSLELRSDNEMFLNTMKEAFEENSFLEKAVLVETEGGYTYNLKKISFEEVKTKEGNSVFESAGIKKEFRFPYYYYTITLKNEGVDDSEYGSMGASLNYIIEPFGKITDTNGVYVGEDKKSVKFNLMKSKEYYVTFKDNFIFSWVGGSSNIVNREPQEVKIENVDSEDEVVESTKDIDEFTKSVKELDNALVGKNDKKTKNIVNDDITQDINEIIKEHCKDRWSDDFQMRAYCEKQEREGYNSLMKSKPSGMSDDEYQTIKELCKDRWSDDFQMMAYCEKQQLEAWSSI